MMKITNNPRWENVQPPQPSSTEYNNYTLELYHNYVEYIHKDKMVKPHLEVS